MWVGISIQDAALSVPQGAHYRADDIYLFPKLGLRREHGGGWFREVFDARDLGCGGAQTFVESVVKPIPVSLLLVKGLQPISGLPL